MIDGVSNHKTTIKGVQGLEPIELQACNHPAAATVER